MINPNESDITPITTDYVNYSEKYCNPNITQTKIDTKEPYYNYNNTDDDPSYHRLSPTESCIYQILQLVVNTKLLLGW